MDVAVGQRGLDVDIDRGVVDEADALHGIVLGLRQTRDTSSPSERSSDIACCMIFWYVSTPMSAMKPLCSAPQQIARTAYVEVLHGNVEARAQIGELLYCPSGGGASLRLTARWAG